MILGIDASRANKKNKTGVEWYAWHIIEGLKKTIPDEHRVVLYSDESLAGALALLPPHWESRLLRWPPKRFWTQMRLSWEMLREKPDVLFVPAHVFPLVHPKKTVMMVHDVAGARFPEAYSWFERWYSLWSARWAAKHLWKVITPSEFTKRELESKDAVVIHHGVDSRYRKIHDAAAIDAVLKKYDIRRPFVLSVGRLEKKKNTAALVRAFTCVRETRELQLVLVGQASHGYSGVRDAIAESPWKQDIRLLGWMDPEEVVYFMNAAEAFVFPSLYEGFGLPVLEAFACGTPVVAGSGSSLEEVAGDSAIFVDPKNTDDIANGIRRVLDDAALRDTLVAKGLVRVKTFSWDLAAQKTKDALLS